MRYYRNSKIMKFKKNTVKSLIIICYTISNHILEYSIASILESIHIRLTINIDPEILKQEMKYICAFVYGFIICRDSSRASGIYYTKYLRFIDLIWRFCKQHFYSITFTAIKL